MLDRCSSYPSRLHPRYSSLNRGCSNHRYTLCTVQLLFLVLLIDRYSSYRSRFHHHSSLNLDYKLPMNMLLVLVLLLLRAVGVLLLCTMEKFHSTDTCSHDTTSHNTQNHGYSLVLLLHRPQLMLLLRVLEVLLGAVGSSHSDRSRTTHSSQHCHRSHSILLTLSRSWHWAC